MRDFWRTPSKSNIWDFWPLRHLIRAMRKHDLTNKKTTTKTNTMTNIFWEHLKRAKKYRLGHTIVFFRAGALAGLEEVFKSFLTCRIIPPHLSGTWRAGHKTGEEDPGWSVEESPRLRLWQETRPAWVDQGRTEELPEVHEHEGLGMVRDNPEDQVSCVS